MQHYHFNSDADVQLKIIGSIPPENFKIQEKKLRTTRVNELAGLIASTGKGFSENKKGQPSEIAELSRLVPEAGIEPAQPCDYWFLRPTRLPIPPPGHRKGLRKYDNLINVNKNVRK